MSRDEVLLITRIKTLNKGNQALSAAWLSMLERAFPTTSIRILERRPRHLLQYTLREIERARDPFRAFDRIADELARLAPGPELAGGAPPFARIELDESVVPPVRFVRIRQRLNLRGRLARLGMYADEYKRRLSACQRARLVVVNPAGEFFPREPSAAFYHLLDAHVSRKLGRPTAIVNHTMDITDRTLRALIPPIYRSLDLVGFRDEKSVVAFREMGGDTKNVLVTPDLALTIQPRTRMSRRGNTVAVAINVPEASAGGYLQQWSEVIGKLVESGRRVVLVSNELPADQGFYAQLLERFRSVQVEGQGLDHDRYAELLASFDLLISSRMHSLILAMAAGTPVVPVEGSSFKITGLFRELGFTEPVIDPAAGRGWTQEVVNRTEVVRDRRDQLATEVEVKIATVRDRISAQLIPRLHATLAIAEAPRSS